MSVVRRILNALAVAALLLAGCAAAPGALLLADESEALERAAVEAAAAPLVARGARVAVLVAARGDDSGADLTRRLDAAGLLAGGAIAPDAIALYVSLEPRYSELRAGSHWSGDLPDAALREARTAILNPALRDGRAAEGVAATLAALEGRLASPPPLGRLMRALGYAVLVALALAALAISPLGAALGRLWRRSPPGRAAQWLVDRTPAGRRRVERITRTTRLRLADRVKYARSWCRAAASGPHMGEVAALTARLAALDRERAALEAGGARGRRLEEELDRLAWAYQELGSAASRLAPPRQERGAKARGGAAAASGAFVADSAAPPGATGDAGDSAPSWDGGPSAAGGPSSDGGAW